MIKSSSDENNLDIDDLIARFRNKEYDIESIQRKLVPYIHNVNKE